MLFWVPLGFSVWQLALINNFEKAALARKVRIGKYLSFAAALGFGME